MRLERPSDRSQRRWALAIGGISLVACQVHDRREPEAAAVEITTESSRPRLEDPLRPSSPIFDGEDVTLRGARGETLGIMVRAEEPAAFELELDGEGIEVQPYRVGWARVTERSSAMYGGSRGPGRYADELVPTSSGPREDVAAYFDLAIAANARPGIRKGQLCVDDRCFELNVSVASATIGSSGSARTWAYFDHRELAEVDSETSVSDYRRLFADHGVILAGDVGLEPGWKQSPALTAGMRYFPVWVDDSSLRSFADGARRWADAARAVPATPFAIPIDEPATLAQRLRVRMLGAALDARGIGDDEFLLAVTDRPRAIYGDAVDVFISPMALPPGAAASKGEALRWTYNGKPPRAGNMTIDAPPAALRSWGWIGYRYDVPLWYIWDALYFRDRYNGGALMDPAHSAITYDERRQGGEEHGNGDGQLAYQGAHPSLRLKVLRRGLQERALLEALAGCEGQPADLAEQLAREVIPAALGDAGERSEIPRRPERYERARRQLLDSLEECQGG